ncbi:esterase-like activity of phytase family protein [Bordetella genomosp. 13]|uniref:esterase-like activity of phytase family protein n=1 Tax=Bordetella genomosp. 13 TaxID=463040 RepID=UPI0011A51110|nr:esterase-like activity of phytase family protein [Bordetella genomosp. 13]
MLLLLRSYPSVLAMLCACTIAWFPGSARAQPADAHVMGTLRFIGEQRIAHKLAYQGTTVGGLSGIDYDPRSGNWVMISDDRSDFGPARWYTAALRYDAQGFTSVGLTGVTPLLRDDGTPYPSRLLGGRVPDAESIRVDPRDGSIWYASEGDRLLALDPVVRHVSRDGRLLAELPTSPMFQTHVFGSKGARNNLSFEGLAFAPDGQSLWVGMEGPIHEDGEPPTPQAGALARFTQYDRTGKALRQVAYPVDPIPAQPGRGKYADNGVSEILALDDTRLLVLERSGVQAADGKFANYIRLYEADVSQATDVAALASLTDANVQPAAKRLVLDLNTLGLPRLDNIEGIAWGPKLSNGHDSLVLVSDDNFNAEQVTLLLAFELLPAP